MKNKKIRLILLVVLAISVVFIPLTFSRYISTFNRKITLSIAQPTYTVVFHSNDGNDYTATQSFVYGTSQNLDTNTYSRVGFYFAGWNTAADGSGDSYDDEELVNNLTGVNNGTVDLYADWVTGVAVMNGVVYTTIHEAVEAVTKDDTEHVIKLLSDLGLDTNDRISVLEHQNIKFNLQNFTIRNINDANIPIIETDGQVTIYNGTIRTNANQGAINVTSHGKLIMTGGALYATGGKQALFNDGGTVEISGTAILSNTSSNRAAVQNQPGATMTITGGTIEASSFYGVQNQGTLTIGDDNDGVLDKTSPSIKGTYGVYSTTNFDYYDGIIKGKTKSFYDESYIEHRPTGTEIVRGTEQIGNTTYKTAWLSDNAVTVTFNPGIGTTTEPTRLVEAHSQIGTLPTATKTNYVFQGWFTDPTDGTKIDATEVIDTDVTFYAHFIEPVASVNGTIYGTLQNAISATPSNSQTATTVLLLKNTQENVTVSASKNIILDLQSYTLRNKTNASVITNKGKLEFVGGTITSSAGYGTIDNKETTAYLTISGGSIIATGTRQAVHNEGGGHVTITGTAYISATASARPAVQNWASSELTITGGTIISSAQQAVNNEGTLIIGDQDGTIDITTPVLQGATYGVTNTATTTFEFYDGVLKGISGSVDGPITAREQNSTDYDTTEVIDGDTYQVKYLVSTGP